VITSHYGVGTLVAFALVVAYGLNLLMNYTLDDKRPSELWLSRVALFSVLIVVWYAYMTDDVFDFLVGAIYGQVSESLFFTQESTAVRSINLASETTGCVRDAFGLL